MTEQNDILSEVERLERSIRVHGYAIDRLQKQRKDVEKQLMNPLLGLLLAVVITALLSSSCTLHVGELMGKWNAEEVVGAWTGLLEGYRQQAKALGTVPYVIASVVLAAINLPVGIAVMFTTPLRMIAMILEMNFPAAVSYLAYVELALILLVFWVVVRTVGPIGRNRELRERLREIDGNLQRHKSQLQQDHARLGTLKGSQEYAEAKAAQDQLEALYEYAHEHREELENMQRDFIEAAVPYGFDVSKLDKYFEVDSLKAQLVAEAMKKTINPLVMAGGFIDGVLSEEQYLADFDRYFHSTSSADLYARLGITEEMLEAFNLGWDR